MKEGLARLNALPAEAVEAELLQCCGSARWARRMAQLRPFPGVADLLEAMDRVWWELVRDDWLEAFRRHPKIGESAAARAGTEKTARWSAQEQAAAQTARPEVLTALAEANRAYQGRFGYIFIVCASGKTSEEMLALLEKRLQNEADAELHIAAEEQCKITRLRLKKLLRAE